MNRIKALRKEKNLTQQQLSAELKKNNIKLSKSLISAYEREEVPLNQDKIREVARYFGVSINYLCGRSNNRNRSLLDRITFSSAGNQDNNIYIERKKQHLTQEELGRKLGVSREYISELELGIRDIPSELWKQLAKVLSPDSNHLLEISYLKGINGKYLPHDMETVIESFDDFEIIQRKNQLLKLLDWAYKNPTFELFYVLLNFGEEIYEKDELKKLLKNIRPNSIYMLNSIVYSAVRMLLDGAGRGNKLDQQYFMKLFGIIEDYEEYKKMEH
ncbi:helix-turn-helix domain-containing protein [Limosilactobacillus reuteri]|uniref:helix-turn-helix domain-containing protein n=1 Tax=Limosilactobacillus reuteri TaxID=1598 RepID=UPI001E4370B6|nr:helix-turn-helix transcriptional regulator [Limosilactobacillus reuteri]MCC4324898.1 helix-turn-helix domain-containing protein [Limosilactobacillus reuteri]MCC4330425.1 helix-turn-helix domain-containing protein [Limosilactobacillus reuteri]